MFKVILDTRGIIKRMFTGAVERWTETGRAQYVNIVRQWEQQNLSELPATELLTGVRQLTEAAIDAYMLLVSGVIPAAWISEAWFTWRYKFLKRKADPGAPTYLMGFDSVPILAEKALFDLAQWVRVYPELSAYLKSAAALSLVDHLCAGTIPEQVSSEDWLAWRSHFRSYLRDYGHMIYNLDFGNPVPADNPTPVLETFKLYLDGQGSNPHERQAATSKRRRAAVEAMEMRLKGRRLRAFQKNLVRAQKYAPLRENGLADVGLSYPLLRQMLLELGRRFLQAKLINRAEDIFWLVETEVETTAARLDQGESQSSLADGVPGRKAIWQAARRAVPPFALPQMKVFGLDLMALKSGGLRKPKGNVLKGVAASPGVVTATACVIHGQEDFSKMTAGDILVAPLTTPAWTPLFARAAGVVTDVGGPLSHGSIVAREYGIPAVLGTSHATKMIHAGQRVTVDGSEGVVEMTPQ